MRLTITVAKDPLSGLHQKYGKCALTSNVESILLSRLPTGQCDRLPLIMGESNSKVLSQVQAPVSYRHLCDSLTKLVKLSLPDVPV